MTPLLNIVRAETMGRSFETDSELVLPAHPRVIPELLIVPVGEDGLLFAGTQSLQVLRGRSSRQLLPRLLPLFDGTRTQDDVRALVPGLTAEGLRNIVSLLYSRGLMEDGPVEDVDERWQDVSSFLGRHNDVSRRNRNRANARARLAAASVRVCGPARFAEAVAEQLVEAGVGDVQCNETGGGQRDLAIAISTGAEADSLETLTACVASSERTLVVRLGEREAHIGPRLIRGLTVCSSCLVAMHPHPVGSPSPLLAELWLGLAAQRAFVDVSGIGPSPRDGLFDVVGVDDDGRHFQDARLAPRMPGCSGCEIPGESWSFDDPRLPAWLLHAGTSISRRADLAPRDHQAHYLVSNIELSTAPGTVVRSSTTIGLPPGDALEAAVAWTSPRPPESARRLSIGALSALLTRVAGQTGEGAARRRIAPTGGNLGSVRVWVLAREIDGLERGAYWYDGGEHSLVRYGAFDDANLRVALGTEASLPPCVLLGAGEVAKCAQKYQGFAYRLVHFDAGIAVAFAFAVAEGLGLSVREYADFDIQLPAIFGVGRRWEYPLPTFALGIYAGPIPGEPRDTNNQRTEVPAGIAPAEYNLDLIGQVVSSTLGPPAPTSWTGPRAVEMPALPRPTMERLDDVLHARRAIRRFSTDPPSPSTLEAIVTVASAACAGRAAAGAPATLVRPVLMVQTGSEALAAGAYEFGPDPPGRLVRRSAYDAGLAREYSNQLGLARSPANLVLVANLREALSRRGTRGYADVALAAGAAIGMAWLAACSYGLVGTAAGGVIPFGFRKGMGMDGFNDCPLLALHFGLAAGRPSSATP